VVKKKKQKWKWAKKKWKGGRWYLDDEGRRVFFIEKMVEGQRYNIKLATHDEDLAVGEYVNFLADPIGYFNPKARATTVQLVEPVFITAELVRDYMASISDAVEDHRKARRAYLLAWSKLGLDLRSIDRKTKEQALATFEGGHSGRTETLNAFARWLVKQEQLPAWVPLVNTFDEKATRAEREAYSVEQLREKYASIESQAMRDVFRLRVETGMHQTEIDQLAGARVLEGPLPEKGAAIRVLPKGHPIAGVIQVMHKSRKRHRVSVDAKGLAAAQRLLARVPGRVHVWQAFKPLVPSNLRHTFATLCLEFGETVPYKQGGIDPIEVQQAMGHAVGSSMLRDRYSKLQVPSMKRLALDLHHADDD
jgi:integrase